MFGHMHRYANVSWGVLRSCFGIFGIVGDCKLSRQQLISREEDRDQVKLHLIMLPELQVIINRTK